MTVTDITVPITIVTLFINAKLDLKGLTDSLYADCGAAWYT